MTDAPYQLYVNEQSTIKVEVWKHATGAVVAYVATRDHPSDVWGPPERCDEEEVR